MAGAATGGWAEKGGSCVLTLRASTRSAASMRVRVEIWSTMAEILGFVGGGGAEDEAGVVVASAEAKRAAEKERTATRELRAGCQR